MSITQLPNRRGLSFDRLRALLEFAEAGSLARAAQGDPVRQSQFSRQIGELEGYFEVELTRRQGNRLALTEGGERLVQIARETFIALEAFASTAGELPAAVTLGGGASLLQWMVVPRLARVQRQLPNTQFRLHNLRTADVVRGLTELTVDVGLVRESAVTEPLKSQRLFKQTHSLFVPRGLLRGRKEDDHRQLLESLPLAVQASGGQFDQTVEETVRREKLQCRIALTCSSHTEACHAVLSGGYASILPSFASADLVPERFVEVPLPMLRSYERIVCLAWNPRLLRLRPGLEKVVNTFAAALTKLEPAAGQSSNRRSRATGSVV
jgi:DNA-binding transcriptional LysR family regulator